MKIIIDDTTTLSEIHKEFSMQFPFLKLKFFNFQNETNPLFSKMTLITDTRKTILDIRQYPYAGPIIIKENQKVISMENNWKKNLGINVQVFRKSGNSWLETLPTNNLTLAEQNKIGEEKSNDLD